MVVTLSGFDLALNNYPVNVLTSICSFDPKTDVLVEWDDGSQNVVTVKDIIFTEKLRKGCRVEMPWGQECWRGQVLAVEGNSNSEDSSDPESDIPLARLMNKKNKNQGTST